MQKYTESKEKPKVGNGIC